MSRSRAVWMGGEATTARSSLAGCGDRRICGPTCRGRRQLAAPLRQLQPTSVAAERARSALSSPAPQATAPAALPPRHIVGRRDGSANKPFRPERLPATVAAASSAAPAPRCRWRSQRQRPAQTASSASRPGDRRYAGSPAGPSTDLARCEPSSTFEPTASSERCEMALSSSRPGPARTERSRPPANPRRVPTSCRRRASGRFESPQRSSSQWRPMRQQPLPKATGRGASKDSIHRSARRAALSAPESNGLRCGRQMVVQRRWRGGQRSEVGGRRSEVASYPTSDF